MQQQDYISQYVPVTGYEYIQLATGMWEEQGQGNSPSVCSSKTEGGETSEGKYL